MAVTEGLRGPPPLLILTTGLTLFVTILLGTCSAQVKVLTPPYFNLASGKKIQTTATCGVNVSTPEQFCRLTGVAGEVKESDLRITINSGQLCEECDPSEEELSHPAEFAIDGTERWWQSPPLSRGMEYNAVNLSIDLEQEFLVAYVFIKMANSPRPGVWILERSIDFGKTWSPWQYFAGNPTECKQLFNLTAKDVPDIDDEAICTTKFSKVVPLENGEIIVSLVDDRPNALNFSNSQKLQDWTKATSVRLRMLQTKTLLGHLMAVRRQDPTVTRRYFYSIKDISIGGRCVCNGHAESCDKADTTQPNKLLCRCQHNTCGPQCEVCCPGFVQKKWQRVTTNKDFMCERCNCHRHSDECIYDPEIDEKKLSLDLHGNYDGGGVCQNCRHNTEGTNCEKCRDGFYRPYGVEKDVPNVCQPCQCDLRLSTGSCEEGSGRCLCKPQYTGENCDRCNAGYHTYPNCFPCDCHINGTEELICEVNGAQCPCKDNYIGRKCDMCRTGFYSFPDCHSCACNRAGSRGGSCDVETGQCQCQPGFTGRDCSECAMGYHGFPQCSLCECEVNGCTEDICDNQTGQCLCKPNFQGSKCNLCVPGYYQYPFCHACGCVVPGTTDTRCHDNGQCVCKRSFAGLKCDRCASGFYKYPECIRCNCDLSGSMGHSCDQITGQCQCRNNFEGLQCDRCKESYYRFPRCVACNCNPAGAIRVPGQPLGGCGPGAAITDKLCECKERVMGNICDTCKPGYWDLDSNNALGCRECGCYKAGTIGGINVCDVITGQCMCKVEVTGRNCDQCRDGTYGLSETNPFGCKACDCNIGGSATLACNKRSGQCICKPRVTGMRCDQPIKTYYFPTLHQHQYEIEDGYRPGGGKTYFAFSEIEFPQFSSKGYAIMSEKQPEILIRTKIHKPALYRLLIRYHNKGDKEIKGKLTFTPRIVVDTEQEATIIFKPTNGPSFTKVADVSSTFVLNPGKWTLSIKVPGDMLPDELLLDYLVLIPQQYYEATLLQDRITRQCVLTKNIPCLHYRFPDLMGFPVVMGKHAFVMVENQRRIASLYGNTTVLRQLFSEGMAIISSEQESINMELDIPETDMYIVVVNYHNPTKGKQQVIDVMTSNKQTGTLHLHECQYSTLCRQVIKVKNEIGHFNFTSGSVIITFTARNQKINAFIDSVTAIPAAEWTQGYIRPNIVCIKVNGECISSEFLTPVGSDKIEAESGFNEDRKTTSLPPDIWDDTSGLIKLDGDEPSVDIVGTVRPNQHVMVVHYYQPSHPGFDVQVTVHTKDRIFTGILKAKFCSSATGCRAIVEFGDQGQYFLDLDDRDVRITFNSTSAIDFWLDYVMLISSTQYTPDVLDFIPIDKSAEFLSECVDETFQLKPGKESMKMCRNRLFALTADYNNGALHCRCNVDGSLSFSCKSFGGQCRCRPNIIGRDCSACKSGYYGFPKCRRCRCTVGTCHPVDGSCVCPPRVTGKNCDKCLPHTFGYDKYVGCQTCECNPNGVENGDLNCDQKIGQCRCLPNIEGRHCDHCVMGHYDFPHCYSCKCDPRGTEKDICDQTNGQCLCKENTDKPTCSNCRPGAFYMEKKNPKGCTLCFCFGTTSSCDRSRLLWSKIYDMKNWNLQNSLAEINEFESTLNSDVRGSQKNSDEAIYWSAPPFYLGNKITSYGGKLTYKIENEPSDMAKKLPGSDVLLLGNNMTLGYKAMELKEMMEIEFREYFFVHEASGSPVKREQFMMVLVNLEAIYIKGTYYEDERIIRLSEVQMDVAKEDGWGEPAYTVEQCDCPPSYEGTSCEKCAPGHYRQQTTPFLGLCSPCECNGHSNECDPLTGQCLNCKDNTEGLHCEKCKEGYFGKPLTGGCKMCACPHPVDSNNFAVTCYASDINVIRCECKPGYTGVLCDKCAPGHYGHPNELGERCRTCGCSGNIDSSLEGSCDHETGACLICANNSTGSNCEHCRDWWYGDAVNTKNCRACTCDRCGAESCDNSNGVCRCKTNVVGLDCDRCPENYYGFHSCEGCKMCECGIASTSAQCDDYTGQCVCQQGVVGQKCDRCRDGYWNYKASGCDSCNCLSEGSVNCDPETGACICQPGFRGANCDQCDKGWVHVPGQGCVICDKCTKFLTDELDQLTRDLTIVQREMRNVSVGAIAIGYLKNISESVRHYKPQVDAFLAGSTENVTSLKSQKKLTDSLKDRTERLHDNINQDVIKSTNTLKASEELAENSKMVNDVIKDVIDIVEITVEWVSQLGIRSQPTTNIENYVHIGSQILETIQGRQYTELVDESAAELETAKETMNTVKEVVSVDAQEKQLNGTQSRIDRFTERLYDLQRLNREAKENSSKAMHIIHMINSSTSGQTVQEFYGMVDNVGMMIDMAKTQLADSSEFVENLKNMTNDIEGKITKFKRGIRELGEFLGMLTEEFTEMKSTVADAVQHADKIENGLRNLENIYTTSKSTSGQSVNAANAYKDISMAIEDAMSAAKNARNLSANSLEMSNGIGERSFEAKSESLQVFETGKEVYDTTKDDLANRLEIAVSDSKTIIEMNKQIEEELQNFQHTFEDQFGAKADEIAMKAMEAEMRAKEAEKKATSILPEDQKMMTDIPLYIAATNESIVSGLKQLETARNLLPNITSKMNYILDNKDLVLARTRNASLDVKELRKKIELARSQANQIIVGLRLFANTTLRLRNPPYLESSGSYSKLSMNVKTNSKTGLLSYIGGPRLEGQNQDYFSLELENGHVVFRFDLGSGSAAIYHPQRIDDGRWHHIEAERIGTVGFLTVEGEPGEMTKVNSTTSGTNSVMMLRPSQTLIYVGGYPSSVQLPDDITRDRFVGAIERFIWNDYPLGLWNFLEGENNFVGEINRPVNVTKSTEGYRFDGDSYVQLNPTQNFKTSFDISFHFSTYKPNGLIMFMYDTASLDFTSVDMRNGHLVFQYDLGGGRAFIMTEEKFNDGKWHTIQIKRLKQNGRMVIDSGRYKYTGKSPGTLQMLAVKELFVGGYSDYLDMPRRNVSDFGFTGCIKNLQFNADTSGFANSILAHKVIPGCPELIARSVNFPPPANNYISKMITTDPIRFHVTMKIRTERTEGLLLYAFSPSDDRKFFSFFLDDGKIKVVSTQGTQLLSKLSNYNDANWHYISVVNAGQELTLNINDEDMTVTSSAIQLNPDVQLYFGGFSRDVNLPDSVTKSQFHGCIEDVTINGMFFNFAMAKASSGVRLNLCPLDISTTFPSTSVLPATPPPTLPPGQCALPLQPAEADPSTATGYRFGTMSNTSRWEINKLNGNEGRNKLSIEFQTKTPDGILMYAADKSHNDFMSIFLKNGYLHFHFNCGSGTASLITPKTYNDGKWHKVQISRQSKKGSMGVDNTKVLRTSSTGPSSSLDIIKPYYFGGLSAAQQIKAKKNLNGINMQYVGCMRNIEIQKRPVADDAGEMFGVEPCSSLAEFGTFFGQGGGYIQLYKKFHIGTDLELSLEVKPRSMSGVLLSVYSRDFLLLELVDGEVQVTFDNGAGAFTSKSQPQFNNEICNGRWHKIEVVKAKHVAYLVVDGIKSVLATGKVGASSADTKHPLYIGGIPEEGKHKAVKSSVPYVGCIRKVKIKEESVSLVGKLSSGNVRFGSCSTI